MNGFSLIPEKSERQKNEGIGVEEGDRKIAGNEMLVDSRKTKERQLKLANTLEKWS